MIANLSELESYRMAVVGATGLVGRSMLRTLEIRNFPVDTIRIIASERSLGDKIEFKGRLHNVEALTDHSFDDVDIALFSAGADTSRAFSDTAVSSGSVVIDNSSAHRMTPEVPLVVPEVNPERAFQTNGIIANPNCSTIQLVVALKPLMQLGIEHVFVSTYQAVSGMGQKGVKRLNDEIRKPGYKGGTEVPYAFNAVPKCDEFLENGYTKEEMKVLNESRKILESPSMKMTVTAVRVPVIRGHSESVSVKFSRNVSAEEVRNLLSSSPGVTVTDDPAADVFPHPLLSEGSGQTFVGRIRQDLNDPSIISMFVVADNILKGAAWNAVQIAELLSAGAAHTA